MRLAKGRYYYFTSQLPFLKFATKPPISRKWFLEEARKWLGERDFLFLLQADINNFTELKELPLSLKEYRSFEKNLRQELAFFRKARKEGREYKISSYLEDIITTGNPLEVERKLLYLRWKFIEEKETGHYFDIELLILYFLKLQILERLFTFDKEKGRENFDKLCEVENIPLNPN